MGSDLQSKVCLRILLETLLVEESDDDYEDIFEKIANAAESVEASSEPDAAVDTYESTIWSFPDNVFQQHFGISVKAFEKVQSLIATDLNESQTRIPLKKQILTTLWLLRTADCYRSVSLRFELEKSTLSKCFFRVVQLLCTVASSIIRWPSKSEKERTKSYFKQKHFFNGLIGSMDSCYIAVKRKKKMTAEFTNQKRFASITLQAICNERLEFLNVFADFPSSFDDCLVYQNSKFYQECVDDKRRFFDQNEYIFADEAYYLSDFCITPFVDHDHLDVKQVLFNKHHSSARSIIDKSFSLLFGRFRRLKFMDMNRLDFVPYTITACCVLHNICLSYDDDSIDSYVAEGELRVQRFSGEAVLSDMDEDLVQNLQLGELRRIRLTNEVYANRSKEQPFK